MSAGEATPNPTQQALPATPSTPSVGPNDVLVLEHIELLERELAHTDPDDCRRRATLLYELAHIKELLRGEGEAAQELYEEAFSIDPAFAPVIRALRRRHRAAGHWKDVVGMLEAEAAVTAEDDGRAELLLQMGEVLASRFADTEGAIRCLQGALALVPTLRRAAEVLRDIYARLEQWDDLLEIQRSMTNATADPAERARLLVEMAAVCDLRLGRAAEAEELYTQALTLDPGCEAATVALRRLYLAHGRWKDLRDLLAHEAGQDHDPEERFADLYRAARLSEGQLQDDRQAATALETAAALRSSDPLPLQALTAIYRRTGRHADHAAALGRLLRLMRDPAERAHLCYRLGRLREDWLQQPGEAVEAYEQALQHLPGHEASARALARLYETFERWEELLDLELLRAERAVDVARRADGYVRSAHIAARKANDPRRAIDLYERAYRLVPGLPEAFRSLERLYRASTRWDSLAELLRREAGITRDGALRISLLRSCARMHEEQLQSPGRAIEVLEQLLKESPGDRETLIQLARLYEDAGRSADLRRCLEQWAKVTEDERTRCELRRRVGELLEGPLHRTEQAVQVYQEILEQAPPDRPTLERLKAIYERGGRWSDLVRLLKQELEATSAAGERAALWLQVGQICRDKLGDADAAGEALRAALEADPQHTPALGALQQLLREQGRWGQLVQLLVDRADGAKEPSAATGTLCTAAEICEQQLRETKRAEELFTRALELDPQCGPARQGLERLYLAAGDRSALEAHYLREAEGTKNPARRLRAYLRLGALFDGMGDDPVGAATAYESALRVQPDQPDALRALATIHRQTQSWERLAQVLARIAGTSEEPSAAVSALKEWAAVVERHLSSKWDPAPIFERILEGDPLDRQSLAALERIALARGARDALPSLALRQLRTVSDPELQAALCTRAALLSLSRGKVVKAADALRRGLQLNPDYLPALQLLRRIDELQEEWGEATELLLQEGELSAVPELKRAALLRAGNTLLDRFGDAARAREIFARVFSEAPESGAAFTRLVALLGDAEQWTELVQAYRQRLAVVEGAARTPLLLELAEVMRDRLLDTSEAIAVLEQALDATPNNHKALAEIAELCVMQQRWREAERYLARLAEVGTDAAMVRDALLQRSQILEEQLGEEEQALGVLQQLLQRQPDDAEALGSCLRIHDRRADWERAVEVLQVLGASGPAAQRINHLVNLAELYSRTLSDDQAADRVLARAAKLCVESGENVERVSDYYERRGDFEGLVVLLGQALDGLPPEGSAGAVAVRLARARLLAGRLLRPSDAEFEIRRALQGDPNSVAARLELAGLHLWGDNLGEATAEYLNVLDRDPFQVEAFRGLYRVFERRGDLDRAAGAAQAVVAVSSPDAPEAKIAAQAAAPMEATLASAVATPLGVDDFWNLLAHPGEPQLGRELLHLLGDYLPLLVPGEVEAAGGGSIIPLAPEEPLAQRCLQLAQVLGVTRAEICIGQGRRRAVSALPGSTPRLVVDEQFASRSEAALFRFEVGRGLVRLLTQSLYLELLEPSRVELVLAAVTSLFERGYGELTGAPGDVEELARSAARSIPRKVKKLLEEPARAYAAGQPVRAPIWRAAAARSAERGGLLLCGDVAVAVQALQAERADEPVRAELLRFAVGPHLYEARRRLGLAI